MVLSLTDVELFNLADAYTWYISIFSLIIGIISNLFIIFVFSSLQEFRGHQCAFYLISESITNIGLLVPIYFSRILACIFGQDPVNISLIWCKIRTVFTQICGLCSLATISFAAFDQYLSTNHRPSVRQRSTLKLAHRVTIVIVCFAIIHSIPFSIFYEIRSTLGCLAYNPTFVNYQTFFDYPVLLSCLPLMVTISCSLLAYRNVRRITRLQVPIIRRRLDHQFTATILARVLCLVTLGIPYIIYCLCELRINIAVNDENDLAIKRLIEAIILSLFYGNFSVIHSAVFKLLTCLFIFRLISIFF
jgi:hypothetical protein